MEEDRDDKLDFNFVEILLPDLLLMDSIDVPYVWYSCYLGNREKMAGD